MKTSEFLNLLKENQGKALIFEYAPDKFVGANYHITEVKNTTYDTVDCGSGTNFWKETIVQLWESPSEVDKKNYLSADKTLAILEKVDQIKPMVLDAEIKFEFGNEKFHAAQLFVNDYEILNTNLIIKLANIKVDCKAKETCGVPVENKLEASVSCCEGSGCC
jgi:hypothetical protein